MLKTVSTSFLGAGLLAAACSAFAQNTELTVNNWPNRPIKIVLQYLPGAPGDITMRVVAEKMQAQLKQPVVIENRSGASGNLAAAEVARALPDGYTWLGATDTLVTVNPHVYKQIGFKVEALQPVAIVTSFTQTLVCNPEVGVKTVRELIAKAKSTPMNYASGGAGVPGHLSMELLLHSAGFAMTHVPYRGPVPAMQDVLAGQVHCGLLTGPAVLPHVRTGKLVALAVSGSVRSPSLPEVPTMVEAGVVGYEASFTQVLYAPAGMPPALLDQFHQAFVAALQSAEVADKLKVGEQVVVGSTPAQAATLLAADSRKWGDVARRIKLGLD